jgi:hypothetical protein
MVISVENTYVKILRAPHFIVLIQNWEGAMAAHRNSIPPFIAKIYGKRPIMAGEDGDAYDQLLHAVKLEHDPKTVSEFLLVKDVADAEWELLRLHGLKANMVNASIPKMLEWPGGDYALDAKSVARVRELLHRALRGDHDAQKDLEQILTKNHLTLDDVVATAFDETIASQVHADRMIGAAVGRRNAACRELERLRALKPHRQPNDRVNGRVAGKESEAVAPSANGHAAAAKPPERNRVSLPRVRL